MPNIIYNLVAIFTIILCAGSAYAAPAQEGEGWIDAQTWPLVVAPYFDSLGYIPSEAHPGIRVGTEMTHLGGQKHALVQTLELGYLAHPLFNHGPHVDTTINYRFCAEFGLCFDVGFLVGTEYMFYPGETYRFDGERYNKSNGSGDINYRLGPSASLGWRVNPFGQPVKIFLSYRQLALVDFLPKSGVPVFLRTQLGIGISLPLGTR